jgi:hypothetical protein
VDQGRDLQEIAAAGFGIATASGAWRSVGRALARIPKQEADQRGGSESDPNSTARGTFNPRAPQADSVSRSCRSIIGAHG